MRHTVLPTAQPLALNCLQAQTTCLHQLLAVRRLCCAAAETDQMRWTRELSARMVGLPLGLETRGELPCGKGACRRTPQQRCIQV